VKSRRVSQPEENRYIELEIALGEHLKKRRRIRGLSQVRNRDSPGLTEPHDRRGRRAFGDPFLFLHGIG